MTLYSGDLAGAVEVGKRSLERFRTLQDAWGMASVLGDLAELAQRRGDYPEAVAMYQESLALARAGGLAYASWRRPPGQGPCRAGIYWLLALPPRGQPDQGAPQMRCSRTPKDDP